MYGFVVYRRPGASLIIIIYLMTIVLPASVRGDEITIFYYIACPTLDLGAESGYFCETETVERIANNLRGYNIELIINSELARMELMFASTSGTHTIFLQTYYRNNFLNNFPLLDKYFDTNAVIPEDYYVNSGWKDAAIDLVTATILYDVEMCEAAIPYFEKSQEGMYRHRSMISWIKQIPRFYIATCALLDGDYKTAITILENISTEDKRALFENSLAYPVRIAWLYLQTGDKQRAFQVMNEVLNVREQANLEVIDVFAERAQLYALAFDYQSALQDINRAIYENPSYSDFYIIRGQVYLYLYEWESARADFDKAVELCARCATGYFYRGVLHYTLIERENALEDFQRYLELAPEGRYAEQAARYIESIRIEIDASGG